jgi:hypothetical protein
MIPARYPFISLAQSPTMRCGGENNYHPLFRRTTYRHDFIKRSPFI